MVLTINGVMVGLRPVDAARAGDRFDPRRVGLDHLSFSVGDRADLDAAVTRYDEHGVEHGPVREVPAMGMAFLAAFDPDGNAIELTAPL
ncbi:VOC family protein [Geodermatophilus sp. DSM 44513]|uniref:VOC family protein n=1 Tax=Geodermatophilus sp. DSM 44513 TaxID=1528104 RepID=UPI001AA18996|nr:VOC family protein [Geodermatophilus sp. DSM 44513]WNV74707.1 VOC family protein [Geodermatophilus sp. DSM 44513]